MFGSGVGSAAEVRGGTPFRVVHEMREEDTFAC